MISTSTRTPTAAPGARATGVRGLVRRRPLTSFVTLAYGVSWLAWLPYVLSTSGLGLLPLHVPALLGTTQVVGVLPGAYLGPLTSALVVTALAEGREGLRHWAHRLVHWRVGWRWYAAVVVGVPAALVLTTAALPTTWGRVAAPTTGLLVAYLPVLVLQFFTTAVAEEPGWRDFALPRLQQRHGPLLGTVVLGLVWAGWHLPLFLTEWGGPHVTWIEPVTFTALCVPVSIVITWVFNRTGQSLPVAMVLHAGINTTFSLLWPSLFPTVAGQETSYVVLLVASTAVAGVLLAATRGGLGLPAAARVPAGSPSRR